MKPSGETFFTLIVTVMVNRLKLYGEITQLIVR